MTDPEDPSTVLAPVVAQGDLLVSLRALRDRLAGAIDATDSARDVASLSARLAEVLVRIDEVEKLRPEQKGTALDEVNARRTAKSAKAAGGSARGR